MFKKKKTQTFTAFSCKSRKAMTAVVVWQTVTGAVVLAGTTVTEIDICKA